MSGGGGTTIETAIVTVAGAKIYYTDSSMTRQTNTSGVVQNTEMPVGTIVVTTGIAPPLPPGVTTTGVTVITQSGTTYTVYEVTG